MNFLKNKASDIDKYNLNGDFIESQAFAYLAVRSMERMPITFPETTGVTKPLSGGIFKKV
jgi:anhydro-N-acetylmuramic acid kinase